jgi:hypothetical protein
MTTRSWSASSRTSPWPPTASRRAHTPACFCRSSCHASNYRSNDPPRHDSTRPRFVSSPALTTNNQSLGKSRFQQSICFRFKYLNKFLSKSAPPRKPSIFH